MTSIFNPSQMGDYYLVIAFMSFISLFILNPIGIYVNRNTIVWGKDKSLGSRLKSLSFKIYPILILLFSLIYFIANKYFEITKSFSWDIFLIIILVLLFKTNSETYASCLNILNKRKVFIYSQIFTPLLTLIFFLGLIMILPIKINIWFYALVIANGAIFIYLFKFLSAFNFNDTYQWTIKNIFSFSSPLIISNLFMWFVFEGYRFLLEPKVNVIQFGLFVVGFGLSAQIVSSLDSIYTQYMGPFLTNWMTKKEEILRHRKIDDYIVFTFSIYTTGLIMGLIFSSFLFDILIDKKFEKGLIFFEAGLFFEFFKSTTNQLKNIGYSENNNNYTFIGYLLGSIILISLSYLTNHPFQHLLVISSFFVLFSTMILMNKLVRTPRIYIFIFISISLYIVKFINSSQNLILHLFLFLIFTLSTGYFLNKNLIKKLIQ